VPQRFWGMPYSRSWDAYLDEETWAKVELADILR
jgi:hypothetical protein